MRELLDIDSFTFLCSTGIRPLHLAYKEKGISNYGIQNCANELQSFFAAFQNLAQINMIY